MAKTGEILKSLRTSEKLTRKQMGEIIGIRDRAVLSYEVGESNPPYDILVKFADHFGVSTDYLLGRTEIKNAEKLLVPQSEKDKLRDLISSQMTKLTNDDPEILNESFTDLLSQMPESIQAAICLIMTDMVAAKRKANKKALPEGKTMVISTSRKIEELPTLNQKASAGFGFDFLDENEFELKPYDVTDIHRHDLKRCFVVEIVGDSMEPDYSNGDCVLVNPNIQTDNYTVGLFKIDNEKGYIKQKHKDCLHSFNPEYDDIPFEDHEVIDCGKVLGIIKRV